MSYRCDVCHKVVLPGKPRLVWTFERDRIVSGQRLGTEIARELSVCESCHTCLAKGDSVSKIKNDLRTVVAVKNRETAEAVAPNNERVF